MSFGDNTLVGYWPAELFTHLADHATMVEWGGEVVNTRANGEHTSTQMGSGHFANDGFGKASYFRNLEIVDADNSLSSVEYISTLAENTNCYSIKSSSNNQWGTYFYYGGPGNNPQCPWSYILYNHHQVRHIIIIIIDIIIYLNHHNI